MIKLQLELTKSGDTMAPALQPMSEHFFGLLSLQASGVIDEYLGANPTHVPKPAPQQSGCVIS